MNASRPNTALDLKARKGVGPPLVVLTAYDAALARVLDIDAVDALLVGDSLGMVVQGHENTLKVTLDHMVYHTAAVARAVRHTHVIADLPFLSYQISREQALQSAGRLVQDGGAHAVKLEGGAAIVDTVQAIVKAGIPVVGHLGLTPQSMHALGGFRVQGRNPLAARRLLSDARALEDAGAYALVLEAVPAQLARDLTRALRIPTIGIGAGPWCDGQVLVTHDLLGFNPEFQPKFVKAYANFHQRIREAVAEFAREVRDGVFPGPEHVFAGDGLGESGDSEIVSLYSGPRGLSS